MQAVLPIAVALLMVASALLAASETAIFALIRMENTREQLKPAPRAALERLMAHPLEALVLIIGLNEACNVFAECFATVLFLIWLGPIGVWWAAPVMFVAILLFCDITPKTFALGYPGGVARLSSRPLAALVTWTHPLARWLLPGFEPPRPAALSEAEFKALLEAGEIVGEIEPQERELIHRVFDFGQRRASEVMQPRDKIFAIDVAILPERLIPEVIAGHFSRVPVYRGVLDNIVGVLHVKDIVARRLDGIPLRLDRVVRPARFVPPGKPLAEIFDQMRLERFQLALVVDEYGSLLGLLTLEDLLEELFGEIRDEFDFEGPEVIKAGPNEWIASGAIEVKKLRELLGDNAGPASAGGENLGSRIMRQLHRVPRRGERLRLGALDLTVERVRGATIERVRVTR